jgi:hypothetical protein
MEINNLDDETFDNWGYFVDLENLDSKIPKNDTIVNKIKCSKFQYSDVQYKEYCDEFKFDINKLNLNNTNIIYNLKPYDINKNRIILFCITSGLVSFSITLLFYYRNNIENLFDKNNID